MISPKICHCIHPFFREYAPVSTPSSYCIRYSVIKRYSVIVLYKMHIVQCIVTEAKLKICKIVGMHIQSPVCIILNQIYVASRNHPTFRLVEKEKQAGARTFLMR